jgi:5-oxoprolinase (ATP-hydrolysing)
LVDAYLSPVLRRYVGRLSAQMPGVRLLFMQSSGGLVDADRFAGKDAVLSGPAGGIVGMAATAAAAGHHRVIGFDMGGTSTDVSHYAGEFERAFDTEVAGVRLRAPMMHIHTIAAGGGSIVWFDGGRLRVGPASAGADPGPACYGRGGPATLTDANVLLGRLQPAQVPAVFGPTADAPLDPRAAAQRFEELARQVEQHTGKPARLEELAAGSLRIAVGSMANAVKRISVARGHDVTRYTLQCFGGAAGQHACRVADALGLQRVFCHPMAGILSAYGMGLAEQRVLRTMAVECTLDAAGLEAARAAVARLGDEAVAELKLQGVARDSIRRVARLQVRYRGTDTPLEVAMPAESPTAGSLETELAGVAVQHLRAESHSGAAQPADAAQPAEAALCAVRAEFEAAYRRRFAFLLPHAELIIESAAVECIAAGHAETPAEPEMASASASVTTAAAQEDRAPLHRPDPIATVEIHCLEDASPAGPRAAGLHRRDELTAGACIDGPALIVDRHATVVVEPGWRAQVGGEGNLDLIRSSPRTVAQPEAEASESAVDPVMLEIFNNLFMNVAEQMGLRLRNTAHSVNIKERLDFSCAVFDAKGALIANAPHMPVHLGSMSESVRSIIARNPRLRPGDVFALNDPYHGGTHLPDVTVITPVFIDAGAAASGPGSTLGAAPDFFVASRGHHADIGGLTPGSMPPFSREIAEEGVLIDDFKLVEGGQLREAALRALLMAGPHPARNPDQNLADLRAQIAANEKGVEELKRLVVDFGRGTVARYMRHVQDNAERCVREVLGTLRDGRFTLALDNGARIEVAVSVDRVKRSARIDFTGTSAQTTDNFNAPRAIAVAAVLYVFRTLIDDDIPLNEGCLAPLDIVVPEGCMLNPRPPGAVVAGNVETSTCITNALYGALGVMAASQCTMNNLTFGNARYQYYETIAGGSGAGEGFAGTSVVQTHMTNSRLTDPEVLEFRFPVRVESFEIRAGSGGAGRWRGGDGGVRAIRFLEPMTAAILSNGRREGACGMAGGGAGESGINRILRADGSEERLGAVGQAQMLAGDVFVISTPGGGGYGGEAEAE